MPSTRIESLGFCLMCVIGAFGLDLNDRGEAGGGVRMRCLVYSFYGMDGIHRLPI